MSAPTAQLLLTPRILWAALLASQGIYVALLVVPGLLERGEGAPDPQMIVALAVAALGTSVASFVMPVFLRRSAMARLSIPMRDVPDPNAVQGFRGVAPTIREYVDPIAARQRAAGLAFVPLILSLALSEAVSIFGFLAGFTGHPPQVWAPFFAVGMTLTAIRFPTERSFFGPVETKTGVALPR